jgi:putative addiction module killer protein
MPDDMVMMRPPSAMTGAAARIAATTPSTLTAIIRSTAAKSAPPSGRTSNSPALLTKIRSYMIEVRKTEVFAGWMAGLRDHRARAKIAARIDRLAHGNPGDVEPEGEGVSELWVHYGPGYRVYFVRRGNTLVILLCGGDKATQTKDIRLAKALAANLED